MVRAFSFYLRGIKYFLWNYIFCWIPFYSIRHFLLVRFYGANISKSSAVHIGNKVYGHARGLQIGSGTVINPECRLDARGGLYIGENVSISREVFLLTLSHDHNSSSFDLVPGSIRIEDDCWLGIRTMIMPGVTVGKGAVIGAGTIVTKDVPPYAIVAGVPGKVIGSRKEQAYNPVFYKPFLGGET
ncbi:hypothetical protein TW84_20365 [Vibrio neptunius]|uniref:acyltransferase n=1 Tax=Vibrio neptunius TaxID=170651 RepID=UPI0005F9C054|nr:acyltransferase [Vibrio neptunius]KJY86189.1 hypothetical protein TW84_20365 [Vibrio neptunius]